jgi:hypothetical protein
MTPDHRDEVNFLLLQQIQHVVQPVGLNDGDDVLHGMSCFPVSPGPCSRFLVLGEVQAHPLLVLADPQADEHIHQLQQDVAGHKGEDHGDQRGLELDDELHARRVGHQPR